MNYPKTFTHRSDPQSSVVVMNAEQESALPLEYLPPAVGEAGQAIAAADLAADAMLSPEYDALLAEREKLEQDRTAFAQEIATAQEIIASQQKKLTEDRATLTAGYQDAMTQLEKDRTALEVDRGLFESAKAGAAPTGDDEKPAADAPEATTKRTRAPKG